MARKMQQSELDQPGNEHPEIVRAVAKMDQVEAGIDHLEQRVDGAINALAERFPTGCLTLHLDSPPESWPSSFEKGTPTWQAALVNAAMSSEVEVTQAWSQPFLVTGWFIIVRDKVDLQTGEVTRFPWMALFCKDGSVVGTSSDYAPHYFARILRVYRPEQWAEGVPIQIKAKPSRNKGRSYHVLRVAE